MAEPTRSGWHGRLRENAVFVVAVVLLGVAGASVALAPERNGDVIQKLDLASATVLVDEGEPAVLLFTVPGCRFCSASRKFLKEVAVAAPGRATYAEIDLEDALPLGERFQVTGVPTVLVLEDGIVKRRGLSLETVAELDEALASSQAHSHAGTCTAAVCPTHRP